MNTRVKIGPKLHPMDTLDVKQRVNREIRDKHELRDDAFIDMAMCSCDSV